MVSTRCIRISVLLVLIYSPVFSVYAVGIKMSDENSLINCFFKNLYNFSFREADSMIVVMKNSNMDNNTLTNIRANLAWWKLLSGDSIGTNLRNCDSCIHESIESGLKNKKKDLISLQNIVFSYSLKARLENYRGNTLKAIIYFYKSIFYINECIDSPIRDEKLNLVLGLYFYFIDYIENEYSIMNALLFTFPKGDKNKGLIYLENCSESDNEMIRTEANYFLLKIYAYTERDYSKACQYALFLTQQHPNNLVYSLEQFKLLLKMKKDYEAEILQRRLIEQIRSAVNINNNQKNHFISQIGELTKTEIKL